MYTTSETTRKALFRATFISLFFLAAAGLNAAYAEDCNNVIRMDLNTSRTSFNLGGHSADVLEVEILSPGVLSVEATAAIGSPELKMALFDENCQPAKAGADGLRVIDRYVSGMALRIAHPGTYRFGVALQDPSRSLAEYRATVRFVNDVTFCQELTHAIKAIGQIEEEPDLAIGQIEPEPDLAIGQIEPEPDLAIGQIEEEPDLAIGQIEPEPDLVEACFRKAIGQIELEPDLLRIGLSSQSTVYGDDDHADTFFFATPLALGEDLGAELDSRWHDDSDVFTFFLKAQRTVLIEVAEKAAIRAGIYDEHGQRLAVIDGHSGFHSVKTLGAGQYYIRVEGSPGDRETYQVSVGVLSW